MPERITYYALLLEGDSRSTPSGLARRRTGAEGEPNDEALKKNGSWATTPVIVSAEHGDMTFDLVEVSEEEARRIIEGFRAKWGAEA